jgi:two-component system, OmpR family, response regulator VicR
MGKRILIVDDDATIAEMLEQTLIQEGYAARKTTQPLRFFDEVREFRPHLILLDLMMPYLDGKDELQLLSLQPDTAGTPVIMITADPTARQRETEYRSLGVTAIVSKPFDVNRLLSLIHSTTGNMQED